MNVLDILKAYAERPTDTQEDFNDVARSVPTSTLGDGLAQAFKSERTPDFGNMVSSLFSVSNSQQRNGLLGQLISSLAPTALSSIAGGVFGKMASARGRPDVDAAQVDALSADQVRDLAAAAQKHDPGVMDRVGSYHAEHPEVVKVLGGAALAVALGQIAQRMKR